VHQGSDDALCNGDWLCQGKAQILRPTGKALILSTLNSTWVITPGTLYPTCKIWCPYPHRGAGLHMHEIVRRPLCFCLLCRVPFRLHRMHEMQSILTDDCGVCQSVCLSVSWQHGGASSVCGGYSVQPLPNYFGLLFHISIAERKLSDTKSESVGEQFMFMSSSTTFIRFKE